MFLREQPALLLLLQPYRISESGTKLRFSWANNVDKPEFIMLEALSENERTLLVIKYCIGTKPDFPYGSKKAALE